MDDVRIGQVWADNDKRSKGRHVRVIGVDETHATVELCDRRGRPARGHEARQVARPGRQTRIRLDRFRPTSTGYSLVIASPDSSSDPDAAAESLPLPTVPGERFWGHTPGVAPQWYFTVDVGGSINYVSQNDDQYTPHDAQRYGLVHIPAPEVAR